MATTGTFTSISGSWTATTPTGNGTSTSVDATWIGIGGVSASDLIQIGTENTVSAAGVVSTAAFYELLPATAQTILTMTVSPGDSMHAVISYSVGEWTMTISDDSTGQSFTKLVAYTSSFSSAEWIQEDPSYVSGKLVPLDNFGTASFTNGSTTNAGSVVTIAGANSDLITLVNSSGQTVATTSPLGSGGNSFSVTKN